MGTEVLRPQDCLIRIAPAVFHRRKNYNGNGNPKPNPNPNPNNNYRKPVVRHDQRRRSPEPTVSKRSASSEDLRPKSNPSNLVLGQVTILRRGESLDSSKIKSDLVQLKKNGDDLMVCGTGRIGPDPEMVPKQIRLFPASGTCRSDVYAGSAFSLSPSPSSLPLPSFFSKNLKSVDDSATRDLRRLLRLD